MTSTDTVGELVATGASFEYYILPHLIENITAFTLSCASTEKNASLGVHRTLDVVARNGTLTDVAVTDVLSFERADAANPDPVSGRHVPSLRTTSAFDGKGEAFDELVGEVMWQGSPDRHTPPPGTPGS